MPESGAARAPRISRPAKSRLFGAFPQALAVEHHDAASPWCLDNASFAQVRDLPTDGLDREAQQVRNVLTAQRQVEVQRAVVICLNSSAHAFSHRHQERSHARHGALAAKQHHPLACTIEVEQRSL